MITGLELVDLPILYELLADTLFVEKKERG